jgi:hypothetical protein
MGRPPGSRNKKTLIREQRIREAAKLARGPDEGAILIDSLRIMEAGMRYFFGRFQAGVAEKSPNDAQVRADILDAVSVAKDLAPYRYARLSAMKLASDMKVDPLDGLSKEELRQKVIQQLQELEALGCFQIIERPANTNRGNGRV